MAKKQSESTIVILRNHMKICHLKFNNYCFIALWSNTHTRMQLIYHKQCNGKLNKWKRFKAKGTTNLSKGEIVLVITMNHTLRRRFIFALFNYLPFLDLTWSFAEYSLLTNENECLCLCQRMIHCHSLFKQFVLIGGYDGSRS